MARLDYILKLMASQEADGLRLRAGQPPEVILGNRRKPLALPDFTEKQLRDFVREITTPDDLTALHAEGAASIHYEYGEGLYICDLSAGIDGLTAEFRTLGRDAGEVDLALNTMQLEAAVSGPLLGPDPLVPAAFVPQGVDDDSSSGPSMRMDRPRTNPAGVAPSTSASLQGVGRKSQPGVAAPRSTHPGSTAPGPPPPPASGSGGLRPAVSIHYSREEATIPPGYGDVLSRDTFHDLLRWMVEQDATDLHITPRFPPTLRVDNVFQPSKGREFSPKEIERVILSILSEHEQGLLERDQSVDLSYEVEGLGRFRINCFRQMYGLSSAIRLISAAVGSLEALKLPPELARLALDNQTGLVLFTGPTGSGKSTAMASIIEQLNQKRQLHIVTLEAPVEYLFESKSCLIQQREVGTHTDSFERGLRDALRENPDVIMVGELRDYETVQMAMSASETGHLILATMHANTTNNAISRLIDVFPDNQKAGARAMIGDVLRAVVNLRLLSHTSGRGLVPAVELLKSSTAVASMIREGKLHNIRQILMTAVSDGMWSFERYLTDLYRRKEISFQDAQQAAPDKKVFEQLVNAAKERAVKRAAAKK